MTAEKLRIGVWVDEGEVFRRDSDREPYPRVYHPKMPDLIEEVVTIARQLHFGATMSSWTAQTEAEQDQLIAKLRKLITKQGQSAA